MTKIFTPGSNFLRDKSQVKCITQDLEQGGGGLTSDFSLSDNYLDLVEKEETGKDRF